jgi:hypothetical protein
MAMDEELENYSIDIETVIPEEFDLIKLREEAIRKVQAYSGAIWTDHNIHDPGITVLEQICFAFADIAFQFQKLKDPDQLEQFLSANSFLSPDKLITHSAFLTFADFTDRLLEHPHIYKVFYIPSLSNPCASGVYDIIVFSDNFTSDLELEQFINELKEGARPICSSIQGIHFPPYREVTINIDVEIKNHDNSQKIAHSYFGQAMDFLRGGQTTADFSNSRIFNVSTFSKKVSFELQSADLVTAVNQNEYTQNIRNISIKDPEFNFVWTLKYQQPFRLILNPKSKINLFIGNNLVESLTFDEVERINIQEKNTVNLKGNNDNQPDIEMVEYSSIQKGLPSFFDQEKELWGEIKEQDASGLQLKGVLTVFDLIISKFISDLEQSFDILNQQTSNLTKLSQRILKEIPGIEYVWADFNDKYDAQIAENKKDSANRFTQWKLYLGDHKNNLHELVSHTYRSERDTFEKRKNTYAFLLHLFGFDFDLIRDFKPELTLEDETRYYESILSFWLKNRNQRIHTVNSTGLCLVRPSNQGFAGLMSTLLNYNFKTVEFVKYLESIFKLIQVENGTSIELKQDFDSFVYWGRSAENYITNSDNVTQIVNEKFSCIGTLNTLIDEEQKKEITSRVKYIHDISEGFLLIEHFELTPHINEPVFGCQIHLNDNIIFSLDSKYLLADIYEILNKLEIALNSESYKFNVLSIGRKQFVNIIEFDFNQLQIQKFYSTRKEAESDQEQLIKLLKPDNFKYQFFDNQYFKFGNVIDPYSFTLSLVFPDWHSSSYKKEDKQRILKLIDDITPPHLIVNPIWLDPFDFQLLLANLKDFYNNKFSSSLENSRTQILEILLKQDD